MDPNSSIMDLSNNRICRSNMDTWQKKKEVTSKVVEHCGTAAIIHMTHTLAA